MPVYKDQTGRNISIDKVPRRIISLVPSQTELLFDLGLDKEVVGITKFCVHPAEWFRSKTRVGGTRQLKIDIIHELHPDLIIANKEENVKEQIEELEKHYPVWISDVNSLDDAYEMIEQIGVIINKEEQAKEMVLQIKENFSGLQTCLSGRQAPGSRLRTAYFIWQNPYMAAGGDTFIHSMLETAGFENIFSDKKRYPEVTIADLQIANLPASPSLKLQGRKAGRQGCQLLLLSSEPFPFGDEHTEEIRAQGLSAQVLLVDGEMFSWYGSRLLLAPEYFNKLLNEIKDKS